MDNTHADDDFRGRMQRLDALIQEAERFTDPAVQAHTREIVGALLELHAAGLAKVLEHVAGSGEGGRASIVALARDELVGSLLLLHGLHPLDVEDRVLGALEKVRPYLHGHGGDVEFLGVAGGAVRLRMKGSCHGCPSSSATLRSTIEQAIYDAAPDVTAVEVEERAEEAPAALVQLGGLSRNGSAWSEPRPSGSGTAPPLPDGRGSATL
jgi:Fe-S cluster biogenesis protein NfuA